MAISPPRIFIHDTDKVEGGLVVLFFALFFPLAPLPEMFLPTLLTPFLFMLFLNC